MTREELINHLALTVEPNVESFYFLAIDKNGEFVSTCRGQVGKNSTDMMMTIREVVVECLRAAGMTDLKTNAGFTNHGASS